MKVSFIIPALNEEKVIGNCLKSINDAIESSKCSAEIIVVNNGSTDRTKDVASSFPNVKVVDELRRGLARTRQTGLEISTGDLLANIDADNILPEKWLDTVLKEFTDDPNLLALSGPLIYHDAPFSVRISTKIYYLIGFVFNKVFANTNSMFQGGNYVLRRKALEEIGGLDTSLEFYGEDVDVGRRVGKIGKVKWTFKLPMYSSGRRIKKQGLLATGLLYAINFLWTSFLGRPFTKTHEDVRF